MGISKHIKLTSVDILNGILFKLFIFFVLSFSKLLKCKGQKRLKQKNEPKLSNTFSYSA
jgi:hypothetical protein